MLMANEIDLTKIGSGCLGWLREGIRASCVTPAKVMDTRCMVKFSKPIKTQPLLALNMSLTKIHYSKGILNLNGLQSA